MPRSDADPTADAHAPAGAVTSVEIASQLQGFTGPLDPGTCAALATEMRRVHLAAGTPLFRQGDAGDAVYFVVAGRLVVQVTRDDGQHVRIGEVGPGESVGEMALVSGEPRIAGVVAEPPRRWPPSRG
jgi:CRP-like cAMP-binding protein